MTSDPIDLVLSRVDGARSSGKDQWEARCPAHEDTSPSLSIGRGDKGVLLTCHRGCSLEEIGAALNLEPRDLFFADGPTPRLSRLGTVERVYPYRDATGAIAFEVVRYRNPKTFRQRKSEHAWSVKGVAPVAYRLPELIEGIAAGRIIWIAEGEKDCDRLASLGLVATCNAGGAGKWRAAHSESFGGARVCIVPDNDRPGHDHAEDVARQLAGIAAEVRVVELPDLGPLREKHGQDVSDWFDQGHTVEELKELARAAAPLGEPVPPERTFPRPLGIADLLNEPEPEDRWLFEGLVPMDGNLLIGGAPKSHKTNSILEAGVAAASATAFLGRFNVPRRHRVGIVLMEDRAHRIRRRLQRICMAHGIGLDELEGWLYLWFRPPLLLGHAPTMEQLRADVQAYQLDVLILDNWSLVSEGDPDRAQEVTPQLVALSKLREVRPLTVALVHHARKSSREKDGDGSRLTDAMRGSGAFGAWYDAGIVLSRLSETSPVGVRAELRDHPSPEPFSFTIADEFPAVPGSGRQYPDGYLRLQASDVSLQDAADLSHATRFKPEVIAWVEDHPGCTKAEIERNVRGKSAHVREAIALLIEAGTIRYAPPLGRGFSGQCYPVPGDLVPPRPNLVPDEGTNPSSNPVRTSSPPPLGGDEGTGDEPIPPSAPEKGRGRTYPCAGCGKFSFGSEGALCFSCRKREGEGAA